MKEYDRLIVWLDYFGSNISRSKGRRVPVGKAIRSPILTELTTATQKLGYNPEAVQARHPKRNYITSGYVSIERRKPKSKMIVEIADVLRTMREKQQQIQK